MLYSWPSFRRKKKIIFQFVPSCLPQKFHTPLASTDKYLGIINDFILNILSLFFFSNLINRFFMHKFPWLIISSSIDFLGIINWSHPLLCALSVTERWKKQLHDLLKNMTLLSGRNGLSRDPQLPILAWIIKNPVSPILIPSNGFFIELLKNKLISSSMEIFWIPQ